MPVHKALVVDDEYAHIQTDLGMLTPGIYNAILHGTFDKAAARGVHVQACEAESKCVALEFKGLSFSHDYYDAGYFIPSGVKRGTKFNQVRVWSEQPMQQVILHWVSGDTG